MAVEIVTVGNLILSRWDKPDMASCAKLQATFAARTSRNSKLFHIAVFPEDTPLLDVYERRLLVQTMQELLPVCAHMAVVVEGRGHSGAVLRSTLAAVRTATSRRYGLSLVGSVERALAWAPGPLPDANALAPILEHGAASAPAAAPERRVA